MGEIFSKLSATDKKGAFLELLIEDVFKDLNLSNVRRQKSGSQYGYDVIGYKDNQCWKAECKNLSIEAKLADIAPKLIWQVDSTTVDKFIIVSVNGISNDLYHLLEKKLFSFPVEIWHGEFLEKVISESPSALKRLELPKPDTANFLNTKPLLFPAHELKFDVVYSKGLPFSYDYFILEGKTIKAYSEVDFCLTATLTNTTKRTFIVQEVIVRTLKFESTDSFKILRQFKQKGLIEPLKLTFIPKEYSGGETKLNNGRLIEVKNGSNEYVQFKLSKKCDPGYYELIFEINCVEGGKSFSLFSSVFCLHKKSVRNDIVNLCIVGKYYDTPVTDILNLELKAWQIIKRDYPNRLKYLGPTDNDTLDKKNMGNTWTINLLKGKKQKENGRHSLEVKSSRKSEMLIDLKIPIEEALYTMQDVFKEMR
jgi:hypothetical protein